MTGAGRYVCELARRLPPMCPDIELTVLLRPDLQGTPLADEMASGGARVTYVDAPVASLRQWFVVPQALRRLAPDVYHYPFLDAPSFAYPTVITVYDLNPLLHPEYFTTWRHAKRWMARRLVMHSLQRAAAVCTISDTTRKTIVSLYPAASDKTHVAHLGVDVEHWQNGHARAETRFRAEQPWSGRPYFLYVGVDRPHKNLERMVRGFALFRQSAGCAAGEGPYLMLAGVGRGTAGLQEAIRTSAGSSDVLLCPPVSEASLAELYREARGFVFVSTSEGFGLPILEAFAAGVPVVAGDQSSLPEVGGDAAEYCSPSDERSIARALERVWADEKLRHRLTEKGTARAQMFSWDDMTRATADVYRSIAPRTGSVGGVKGAAPGRPVRPRFGKRWAAAP
jgi:glycosyltransferase involved in cell wall biosynthesis